MLADRIHVGDTIGIISPCHVATEEKYARFITGLKAIGFNVKEGKNLYNSSKKALTLHYMHICHPWQAL